MVSPIDVDKEQVKRIIEMMAAAFISSVVLDIIDLKSLNKEEISKKPLRKIPVRVQKVVDAL